MKEKGKREGKKEGKKRTGKGEVKRGKREGENHTIFFNIIRIALKKLSGDLEVDLLGHPNAPFNN